MRIASHCHNPCARVFCRLLLKTPCPRLAMAASSSSDRAPRDPKRQRKLALHNLPDLAGLSRDKVARIFAQLREKPELVTQTSTSAHAQNESLHYYFDRVKCCRTLECEGGGTFPWVLHVVTRNHQHATIDNEGTINERRHQQTTINNEETINQQQSTMKNASMVASFVDCF